MSRPALIVTGGLGLIGAELVERWDAQTYVIDDGRGAVVSADALLSDAPRMVIPESVERAAEVLSAGTLQSFGAAAVVHCAAPVGPVAILEGSVLESMVSSTRAACDIAAMAKAPLIVLSSSEVYGTTRPQGVLQVPDTTWAPRWEYAAGKVATELIAGRHLATTGLPTCIVRPWNVTGPRQSADKGFVLPRWADAAMAGKKIEVYGDGRQERAIMYVGDLAEMLVDIAANPQLQRPGTWSGQPLDAATPANRVSMGELAELVSTKGRSRYRSKVARHVRPEALHGPLFREASAGSKLPPSEPALKGWTPLEEIIDRVLTGRRGTVAP